MKITYKGSGRFDIEVDSQIIGSGNMVEDENDGPAYLERIDIDDVHQGKGYGTQALQQLADDYGPYYLAADNADAARLYDRIGEEMDSREYDKWGFAIDQGFGVHKIG